MVSDIDIYRSANELIKQHGELATIEAAQMADEMLEKGDIEGQRAWIKILEAVKVMQRRKPVDDERVH